MPSPAAAPITLPTLDSLKAADVNQAILEADAVPGSAAQQLVNQERWLAAIEEISVKDEVSVVTADGQELGKVSTNNLSKVLDSEKLKGLDIRGADFSDFYVRTKDTSGAPQDMSLAGKILSADLSDKTSRDELATMLENTVFNKTTRFHADDKTNQRVFVKLKELAQQYTDQSTQPTVILNGMAIMQSTPLRMRQGDDVQLLESTIDKQAALTTGAVLTDREKASQKALWNQQTASESERLKGQAIAPYHTNPLQADTFTPRQPVTSDTAIQQLQDAYTGANTGNGAAQKAVVKAFGQIPEAAVRAKVLESLATSTDPTHTAILNTLVLPVGAADSSLEQVLQNYTEDSRNQYKDDEYTQLSESSKTYVRERLHSIASATSEDPTLRDNAHDLLQTLEPSQKLSKLVAFYTNHDSVTDAVLDPADATIIVDRELKATATVHGHQVEPAKAFEELYQSLSAAQRAQVRTELSAGDESSVKRTLVGIMNNVDSKHTVSVSGGVDDNDYQIGLNTVPVTANPITAGPPPRVVSRNPSPIQATGKGEFFFKSNPDTKPASSAPSIASLLEDIED